MRRRAVLTTLASLALAAFAPGLLGGCAEKQQPSPAWDERDPKTFSDDELLHHYYELEEFSRTCDRERYDGPGLGVGSIFGSGGTGFGVGMSTGSIGVGGRCDSDKLRQRLTDVRLELHRRGINP